MTKETRVQLENDEAQVLHVASRILAAYVGNYELTAEQEAAAIDKSVDLALRLTHAVDVKVSAGAEMHSNLQNDPNWRPLG